MKQKGQYLLRSIVVLLSCILTGVIFILAVYSIPTETMWSNVKTSLDVLEQEGIYYSLLDTLSSRLDNYTDALMIGNTITSCGKGIIDDAMSNYRTSGSGLNNIESLSAYVNRDSIGFWSYGRYWHGYLVFLKPLFVFFNYAEIRWINMLAQTVLMASLCVALTKRKMTRFCIPVVVAWYLLCPAAVMMSLQFSTVFYISFGSSLVVLLFHEKFDKQKYSYVFMIVGAMTSYFDMLTYPTLTIVLPLTFVILLRGRQSQKMHRPFCDMVGYGAAWAIGLAVMWFGKWCLATMLTGTDYISQSLSQILMRTSTTAANGDAVVITEGLKRSIEVMFTQPTPLVLIGTLVICIVLLAKNHKDIHCRIVGIYPYVVLACVPIVWLIVTCNHSTIHFWFTFRNLSASVFVLLSGILAQYIGSEVDSRCCENYKFTK